MMCARDGCDNPFKPATHNQKYCCSECCRIATNAKIMERYYRNKALRSGKQRTCSTRGCDNVLSRYNYEPVCSECNSKKSSRTRVRIQQIVEQVVVWQ